jgi:flagellar motor switch protein FliM
LGQTELTLRDVVGLKAGDVIPIDLPRNVTAKVQGVPIFRGQFGVSRGSYAVKLTEQAGPEARKLIIGV